MKLVFLNVFLFGSLFSATAQLVNVKGIVKDIQGNGIPYVNLKLQNNIVISVADIDGRFSINLNSLAETIVFSSLSYQTQTVKLEGKNYIEVVLEDEYTLLDDIMVIGYGTQKKSDITGAISSVTNKEFKDQPVSNLVAAIEGKLSGVQVTSPSGTPGAGLFIAVRGTTNPLYVVDGIPLLSESNSAIQPVATTDGTVTGDGQVISSLTDIDPNEIESVEVLKDASAAAIYGARAANGVILITTKRGEAGKTQLGINYYTGIQEPTKKIDFLSSKEFVSLIEDARKQDLARYKENPDVFGPDFNTAILTNPLPESFNSNVNTNWLDAVTAKAPITNIELSARGGNDKTRFFIGSNYFDQKGIVLESGYKRYGLRLNLDHKVSKNFVIGSTISLSRSDNRRSFNDPNYTGIITNAIGASPLMPIYDTNGAYSVFENYEANWLSDNPVKSAKEIIAWTYSNRMLGTIFGEYALSPGLRLRTSWSANYQDLSDEEFYSPLTANAQTEGGRLFTSNFRKFTGYGENTLSFTKTIEEDHTIDGVVGTIIEQSKIDRSSARGQGFPLGSGLRNLSSAAIISQSLGTNTPFGLVSYIGRLNYGYKGKYLLSVSSRVDGSSRFSKENKYGVFPAASFGWRISKEGRFAKSEKITDLKLRASYGYTGDQEIGDFQNISFYGPTRYNGQSGLKPRNLADPTLTWQQNVMANIGIDFEFWAGRLAGSFELFKSNKTKLLSQDPIAGTTGFQTTTRNSGEIENRGWESQLIGTIINNRYFRWTTTLNVTHNKSIVKSLTQDNLLLYSYNDISATHILKVGQPVGSFWGIKFNGIDTQTGEPTYEDLNKDGTIDDNDAQIIGKAAPDFYGGLNNNLYFGAFDLGIITQFSKGNQIYNWIRPVYESVGWANEGWDNDNILRQVYSNNAVYVKERWMKPGDQASIPRASLINKNYIENSSQFVEDGSFFRIKTIVLGYSIKPTNKKVFHDARIYAQVQNAFTFTKYKGFDPEVSSTGGGILSDRTAGIDYAAYPQARTYTVGVNVHF